VGDDGVVQAWKTPFGLSEGMILAASDPSGSQIFLSAPDPGAQPGMIVT
jgi:tRNA-binding EMAP/Myf-like protein